MEDNEHDKQVKPVSAEYAAEPQKMPPERSRHRVFIWIIVVAVLIAVGCLIWVFGWFSDPENHADTKAATTQVTPASQDTPAFKTEVVVSGKRLPWEMAFVPDGTLLFTERDGTLSGYKNGQVQKIANVPGVREIGEGGLMGLAVDPDFATNRSIYLCYNSVFDDIRVVRWELKTDMTLGNHQDVVAGIPTNTTTFPGRHSGCRVAFGPDSNLWVGTGDTAQGDTAVQPKGLGGKILRVTRDGRPVAGNLKNPYDQRIFSYGHRNVQGLVFFPQTKHGVIGLSIEHGSDRDDEVNELRGGNFGWAPPASGYDERVSMTDTTRYPEAIEAIWSSGFPTQAPSGGTIIKGAMWKGWDGALAMAMLKDTHVKVLRLDQNNAVIKEERILDGQYGRLRSVVQGPDGALYVASGNRTDDKILRLTASE